MYFLIEMLIVLICVALTALRLLPTPTIPLFILGWLSLRHRRSSWRALGLKRPVSWIRTLLIAGAVAFIYQALSIFIMIPLLHQITGEAIDLTQFAAVRNNLPIFLVGILLSWTLAAFGEELVFRGYLLNRLAGLFISRPIGQIVGLLVSALLFGLGHSYQGQVGAMENFLVGLLLGIVYLSSSNNLWLPIFAHGLIDTIGFTLLFFGMIG